MQALTRYSIIRYVPSNIAGEFINVGAVVCSNHGSKIFDYSDSPRVRAFSASRVSRIRDEMMELHHAFVTHGQPTLFDENSLDPLLLDRIQHRFCGILQLSDPMPTSLPPDQVKPLIEQSFLSEQLHTRSGRVSVTQTVRQGVQSIEDTIHSEWIDVGIEVRRNVGILGGTEMHEVDVAVGLDDQQLSVIAFNCDIKSSRDLHLQLSAAFYSIMDMGRGSSAPLGAALLIRGNCSRHKGVRERLRSFESSSPVAIVDCENVGSWARETLRPLVAQKIRRDIDDIGRSQASFDFYCPYRGYQVSCYQEDIDEKHLLA